MAKWKAFCSSVALAACSLQILGQAKPTAIGPGTSVKIGGGYSDYHINYGERYLGGATAWADANVYWRWGVEAEARWLRQNQNLNTHATTYLIGPRISLLPGRIEPYAKFLVGRAEFNFPYDYARGSYFAMAGGGGLDLHLNDRIQLRVLDVEYQKWPQFTFGSMSSYGVGAGINIVVYRGTSWTSR